MGANRRVEHGPPTPPPDNLEITRARRGAIAIGQEEEPQERAEKEKHHPFALLTISCAFFLGRIPLHCQSFSSLLLSRIALGADLQEPGGILGVHLLENLIRQPQTINPPAPLRRYPRRRVVKIVVFGFQKPVIGLVQLIVEDLLRRVDSARDGVGSK